VLCVVENITREEEKFMNIKPLHDHVVVKPVVENEMTASGIVLPGTIEKERPERGEVVAIGEGRFSKTGERIPMCVKVGDVVVFKNYPVTEIKIDGQDLLVVKEEDIMAVLS